MRLCLLVDVKLEPPLVLIPPRARQASPYAQRLGTVHFHEFNPLLLPDHLNQLCQVRVVEIGILTGIARDDQLAASLEQWSNAQILDVPTVTDKDAWDLAEAGPKGSDNPENRGACRVATIVGMRQPIPEPHVQNEHQCPHQPILEEHGGHRRTGNGHGRGQVDFPAGIFACWTVSKLIRPAIVGRKLKHLRGRRVPLDRHRVGSCHENMVRGSLLVRLDICKQQTVSAPGYVHEDAGQLVAVKALKRSVIGT